MFVCLALRWGSVNLTFGFPFYFSVDYACFCLVLALLLSINKARHCCCVNLCVGRQFKSFEDSWLVFKERLATSLRR